MFTSLGTKIAQGPNFSTISFPPLDGRSQKITFAPFRKKRSAVARPKPEAAPVTNAILFDSIRYLKGSDKTP